MARWDGVTAAERLRSKFVKDRQTGCWEWVAGLTGSGYGSFWYKGRKRQAHRVALEVLGGIVAPQHLEVCHKCDNPRCVNPGHLFLGSRVANMTDAKAKGRTSRGVRRPLSKLVPEDVRKIRSLAVEGAPRGWKSRIAAEMGVSNSVVSGILAGTRWSHVS